MASLTLERTKMNPCYPLTKGKAMSESWFMSRLRLLCKWCRLPSQRYSFRIRAATTAAALVSESTVKATGQGLQQPLSVNSPGLRRHHLRVKVWRWHGIKFWCLAIQTCCCCISEIYQTYNVLSTPNWTCMRRVSAWWQLHRNPKTQNHSATWWQQECLVLHIGDLLVHWLQPCQTVGRVSRQWWCRHKETPLVV